MQLKKKKIPRIKHRNRQSENLISPGLWAAMFFFTIFFFLICRTCLRKRTVSTADKRPCSATDSPIRSIHTQISFCVLLYQQGNLEMKTARFHVWRNPQLLFLVFSLALLYLSLCDVICPVVCSCQVYLVWIDYPHQLNTAELKRPHLVCDGCVDKL